MAKSTPHSIFTGFSKSAQHCRWAQFRQRDDNEEAKLTLQLDANENRCAGTHIESPPLDNRYRSVSLWPEASDAHHPSAAVMVAAQKCKRKQEQVIRGKNVLLNRVFIDRRGVFSWKGVIEEYKAPIA